MQRRSYSPDALLRCMEAATMTRLLLPPPRRSEGTFIAFS
jgi:hypothetical protein